MSTLVERGETIKDLEASLEEKGKIKRDDAMEKASSRASTYMWARPRDAPFFPKFC